MSFLLERATLLRLEGLSDLFGAFSLIRKACGVSVHLQTRPVGCPKVPTILFLHPDA